MMAGPQIQWHRSEHCHGRVRPHLVCWAACFAGAAWHDSWVGSSMTRTSRLPKRCCSVSVRLCEAIGSSSSSSTTRSSSNGQLCHRGRMQWCLRFAMAVWHSSHSRRLGLQLLPRGCFTLRGLVLLAAETMWTLHSSCRSCALPRMPKGLFRQLVWQCSLRLEEVLCDLLEGKSVIQGVTIEVESWATEDTYRLEKQLLRYVASCRSITQQEGCQYLSLSTDKSRVHDSALQNTLCVLPSNVAWWAAPQEIRFLVGRWEVVPVPLPSQGPWQTPVLKAIGWGFPPPDD